MTAEQIAAVAEYISTKQNNNVYALAIVFSAYTGLRAAELSGLEVGDLTLSEHVGTAGAISVERTKTKRARPTDNTPRLGWITDTPKTDESIRTVPFEAWLADDLREYLKTHPHADDPKAPLFP